MRQPKLIDYILLTVLALIWASAFFNIKIATYSFGPVTIAFLRVFFGAIPVLLLCYYKNIKIEASHTIGKYDNKWYIPEGVEWSFKKDTDWIWFKIEFTPEMLTKLNLDSGNDSLINGNQGWMREDVLRSF